MIHFRFTEQDRRYLFLKGDTKEDMRWLTRLKDHMNLVDPICYLKTYTGIPFTQDFLFDYTQPTGDKVYWCSIGLWQVVYKFLKLNNVPFDGLIENQDFFKLPIKHTFEEFKEIVDSWGLKFTPRPYQYECAYKILQWRMSISELATRAGKTLLAYLVFRYAMEHMGMKRILMIVPSISLVKQGYDDFNEYAEFFKTECVWGGGKLVESSNLTIGTFQSLIGFLDKKSKKYNPSFFDGYDCVFVDETHRAKANQIKTIISQNFMKDVKIVFGMTGTLPKEKTIDFYCVHSLLGPKIQAIKPRELMDAGYISDIDITQIRMNYEVNEERKKNFIKCTEYALCPAIIVPNAKNPKKKDKVKLKNPEFLIQFEKDYSMLGMQKHILYEKYIGNKEVADNEWIKYLKELVKGSAATNMLVIEKMMTHLCKERVDYICDTLIPSFKYNSLILAHHTEYLEYLYKIVKEKFPEKHVDLITGKVSAQRREEIKQMLKDNNDCILLASYGCMSTGITLGNLCYGVLFESFKSGVINMQSLGRGLGLSKLKDKYIVYDFIDVFDKEIGGKKLYLQGLEKIKIYKENQYNYKIINVKV